MSPLFRLQQDVFALISIANLLLLECNRRLLDPPPLLNYFVYYCPHIPVFFPPQFCFLFSYSYNSWLSVQNLYNYNNSFFPFCLHPWHRSFFEQTLPSVKNVPSPYLFFLLPLLVQALLEPIIEALPASLSKLEAVVVFVIVSLVV